MTALFKPGVSIRVGTRASALAVAQTSAIAAQLGPHETALGPWFDVCRPACCENVRAGFKLAAAGVAP